MYQLYHTIVSKYQRLYIHKIPIEVIIVACILLSFKKNPLTLLGPMRRNTPAMIHIY